MAGGHHDHGHSHHGGLGHAHAHGPEGSGIGLPLAANGVLLVVQVVGAIVFGSLALLADSVHQLADVAGLIIAGVAFRVARKPSTSTYSYGLGRAEVLGALANAILLLAGAAWILVETIRRVGHDHDVAGRGVVILALVGLAVNGGSAWRLHRHAPDDLNLQGAALHLAADAAGSFGVLIAGLAAMAGDDGRVDLIVSVMLMVLIVWSGVRLAGRSIHILLEAAPEGRDGDDLAAILLGHPDVTDVHHVHTWSLDSGTIALTAHVEVEAETLHDAQEVSDELDRLLHDVGVDHTTLQLECHPCVDLHH